VADPRRGAKTLTEGKRKSASAATTEQAEPPGFVSLEGASLLIVHSPDDTLVGKVVALGAAVLCVGRDPEHPGVRILDPRLSRTHFRITYDGHEGAYRIGDSASRNGTYVDGARVPTSLLRFGSIIKAGNTVFMHREGGATGAEPMSRAVSRLHDFAALHGLSERERDVLSGTIDGLSVAAIAERLDCKPSTVKTYMQRIFDKTKRGSQLEVLALLVDWLATAK
jgi:DNA-binding CsgD family transcriptional regulator